MNVTEYDIDRFREIMEEIKTLAEEAYAIIPYDSIEKERAKGYWYPQLVMSVDNDHQFLGGSMFTMEDTFHALEDFQLQDEEEEDEELEIVGFEREN